MPPAQHVSRSVRRRVGERLQDERLGVPEGVAVVARAGQALRRDRPQLGAPTCLQELEEREPHGLLQLGVALELDVSAVPEVVEVGTLRGADLVPARLLRLRERCRRLRTQRGDRAHARPGVREELDEPQLLARRQLDGGRHTTEIVGGLGVHGDPLGSVEEVIHRRHHVQPAPPRRVREQDG